MEHLVNQKKLNNRAVVDEYSKAMRDGAYELAARIYAANPDLTDWMDHIQKEMK